jgi:hypothetical protein
MFSYANNGMVMFEGVVEDRNDPLKLGRVRVRIFGFHTQDKSSIKTEGLHWASVLMPVTSASTTGVGETPALVEGSHVVGYFRDGSYAQDPVVIGSILGIPIDANKSGTGFFDPRTSVPASLGGKPFPRWIDEPDTPRLARNEKADQETILSKKNSTKITGIATPTGTYDQVASPYNAKYPYNKVLVTESGHTVEYDDSPGAERVHIAHRSGTFIEMHPDGTIVIRSTKDTFDLTSGNKNEYVKGTHNLTIDAQGNIYCKGDYTFKTDNNMKFVVAGNVEWEIGGYFKETITGDSTTTSKNISMTANTNMSMTGSSKTTIKGGGTTETLNSNYTVSTGTFSVTASSTSFS